MYIYILSVVSFLLLLYIYRYFAPRVKLIDNPNYRKKHSGNIP